MKMRVPESQRDCGFQPKVAELARLPWVASFQTPPNPNGVEAILGGGGNPVGFGGFLDSVTQGSAARNPGLSDVAPLGQTAPPAILKGSVPENTRT